jgi:DNA replication licensing factor MCM5
MEQQTISIAKAGITTMLNTRCSVLAAANPRFGTYDDLASTSEQMDFETTILSRFDMMFLVRDVRDPDRDYNLAKHLCGLHKGEVAAEVDGEIPVAKLKKYLNYCRSKCEPRISNEAGETLANHYISIRKGMKEDKEAGKDSAIPITVRQLEAIIRISESLAKMELKDEVDMSHVEEALRLFTVSTLDSANKDRAAMSENLSEEDRDAVKQAEEQIRRRIARGSRTSKFELERWLVTTCGVEDRIARRAIHGMVRSGELIEKSNMTLQRKE